MSRANVVSAAIPTGAIDRAPGGLSQVDAAPKLAISPASQPDPCVLCGDSKAQVLVEGADYEYACKQGVFSLVKCAGCGHVSSDPMPGPDEIASLYPPTYYTVNPKSPLYLRGLVYRKKMQGDIRRLLKYARAIDAKSIVDIGCGDAERLFNLKDHLGGENEVIGLDLMFEQHVIDRGRREGVSLIEGNVESDLSALRQGGHDLIIMTQIIEHLRCPNIALDKVRDKLSTGGRVLIETPNLGGLDYSIFKRKYWGGYHIPRHLHLFTHESLGNLVERSGYRIIEQGSRPSPGFWIISLRNRLGLNSRERGRSFFEFLNFANLPVVGFFTALDHACIQLRMRTSNQYLLAEKA